MAKSSAMTAKKWLLHKSRSDQGMHIVEQVSGLGSGSMLYLCCVSQEAKLKPLVIWHLPWDQDPNIDNFVDLILSLCLYLELPYSGSLMNFLTRWMMNLNQPFYCLMRHHKWPRKSSLEMKLQGRKWFPWQRYHAHYAWASHNNFDPILRRCSSMILNNNYYYKEYKS